MPLLGFSLDDSVLLVSLSTESKRRLKYVPLSILVSRSYIKQIYYVNSALNPQYGANSVTCLTLVFISFVEQRAMYLKMVFLEVQILKHSHILSHMPAYCNLASLESLCEFYSICLNSMK